MPRSTRRVIKVARLLDSQFRVPGTQIRFGLDPLLGLIPGVGDTVTAIIGGLAVIEAIKLKLGAAVVVAMLFNIAVDWLVGLVPGVDIVADTMFKAHLKNARLLQKGVAAKRRASE